MDFLVYFDRIYVTIWRWPIPPQWNFTTLLKALLIKHNVNFFKILLYYTWSLCYYVLYPFVIIFLLHNLCFDWNTWTWTHLHQIASSSDYNHNLSFQEISTHEKPKDLCLVVKRFNDIFIQYGPLESSLRLD